MVEEKRSNRNGKRFRVPSAIALIDALISATREPRTWSTETLTVWKMQRFALTLSRTEKKDQEEEKQVKLTQSHRILHIQPTANES